MYVQVIATHLDNITAGRGSWRLLLPSQLGKPLCLILRQEVTLHAGLRYAVNRVLLEPTRSANAASGYVVLQLGNKVAWLCTHACRMRMCPCFASRASTTSTHTGAEEASVPDVSLFSSMALSGRV